MANNVLTATSIVTYAAIPTSNYAATGAALSGDTFEQADRLSQNPLGAKINTIRFNVAIRGISDNGIIEYAMFKIERATAVPQLGDGQLPDQTSINSLGLQAAMRQFQPGRVLHFGQLAIATEQPRVFVKTINYAKFKMSTLRTGDYYGIIIHNRNPAAVTIDVQMMYKSAVV